LSEYVTDLANCGMNDVSIVGGKNASLGEMISSLQHAGVSVPPGFATTAQAFRDFLAQDGLDRKIAERLDALDVDDVEALVATGREIREAVRNAPLPMALTEAISVAWRDMDRGNGISVAVRSSATAEDLPEASFAGQQETFLNVVGLDHVLDCVSQVFVSLYNDRAIAYRVHHGFAHADVALSAGIQLMARSDLGSSGVMFTLDTESGFNGIVLITSAWGLGESVVQGAVNPDEFCVYKAGLLAGNDAILRRNLGSKTTQMIFSDVPGERVKTVDVPQEEQNRFSLSDAEVEELARQAIAIEKH
jgi:pyruvate,water dikinase